jgi:hypothetical protein
MVAVYELDGDTLVVSYDLESAQRPADLRPAPDRPLLRISYERAALPEL